MPASPQQFLTNWFQFFNFVDDHMVMGETIGMRLCYEAIPEPVRSRVVYVSFAYPLQEFLQLFTDLVMQRPEFVGLVFELANAPQGPQPIYCTSFGPDRESAEPGSGGIPGLGSDPSAPPTCAGAETRYAFSTRTEHVDIHRMLIAWSPDDSLRTAPADHALGTHR